MEELWQSLIPHFVAEETGRCFRICTDKEIVFKHNQSGVLQPRRDSIPNLIDPFGYLSNGDCWSYEIGFKDAVVQFIDKEQLHKVDCDAISDTFGGLRLGFEVSDRQMYDLTAEGGTSEFGGGPYTGGSCMGLNLRLGDGREVTTTVTHAFVALYQHRYPRDRLKNFIVSKAKDVTMSISKGLGFVRKMAESMKISAARPLREPVQFFRKDPNEKMGVITQCFDTPDWHYLFPHGFPHDLSLISATPNGPLPVIATPPNTPRITGRLGQYDCFGVFGWCGVIG
ncbi:hypothetical protein BJ508DRAFT_345044 [Ascobolus immersus RN42]|uniref:Uncharacterized protein n=1 Tax=Ascobolus immersus RN42 TaxID=1160509 RepID=A0A3N4IM62_ASCIM|nr:hypothetical protein BJ508DRAFT_345044 [Ascobolus immersus RN42]